MFIYCLVQLHTYNINIYIHTYVYIYIHIIFTWLNAVATITHIVKLDVATIQGRLLFESGIYYTEASSVQLLFNNYNSIELKNKGV